MANFLQMDGSTSDQPDPNWDTKEAIRKGLLPTPSVGKAALSVTRKELMRPEVVVSLGSLAFEGNSFTLESR